MKVLVVFWFVLYNKINLLEYLNEFKKWGISNFRIELLDESYEEVIKLIERVRNNE